MYVLISRKPPRNIMYSKYSMDKVKNTIAYWKMCGKTVHFFTRTKRKNNNTVKITECEFWERFNAENS